MNTERATHTIPWELSGGETCHVPEVWCPVVEGDSLTGTVTRIEGACLEPDGDAYEIATIETEDGVFLFGTYRGLVQRQGVRTGMLIAVTFYGFNWLGFRWYSIRKLPPRAAERGSPG